MPDEIVDGNKLRTERVIINEKKEPIEARIISKVITGNVTKRKKTLGDKIGDIFLGEEAKNVAQYVLWDVLVPNVKDLIFDMVKTALHMRLYGEPKDDRIRRDRDRSILSIDYTNRYRPNRDRDRDRDRPSYSSRSRTVFAYEDIVIPKRVDAERVLAELADMIEDYEVASIADLYDLLGEPSQHTDKKYGWDSLGRATIERVRDGYILNMPRPIELN
jgi:hypothetical protein